MEQNDFLKRISDLAQRCERNGYVTSSLFLTPAETYLLKNTRLDLGDTSLLLSGGIEGCERRVAFFLPYYQDAENFDVSDTIKAIRIKAFLALPDTETIWELYSASALSGTESEISFSLMTSPMFYAFPLLLPRSHRILTR